MQKTTQEILQNTFGLESFREGQEDIISSLIEGNDTLIFMPTGGGKSLTYQLPGIYGSGITLVISPLISLMKDQVDALRDLGIRAELLNSSLSEQEKSEITQELKYYDRADPEVIQFLYIAPERLNSQSFIQIIHTLPIALIAIDEAHCISQWGHDFRPSYMRLRGFIENLRQVSQSTFPIAALTATATPKVREDIVERLGLTKYQSFITGFDRKNIILVVREISAKEEKQEKTYEIIQKTPGVGIIYCSSRKHVVELSEYLLSRRVKTGVYKGDLSNEVRQQQQNAFMNDEYKVMVATNAFGMGIDKKDIRFVIHYNLPGSIENYYQEVGRAGRDGRMSYAVVLASYGDTKIQEFFIENSYPERKQVQEFYRYLYKDFTAGEGKAARIAKTYAVMARESGLGNDMLVASLVKILEKYDILKRGIDTPAEDTDFRGRGLLLLRNKENITSGVIDWEKQDLLREEAYSRLENIKKLLFYPSCRKRSILEYFGDAGDLEKLGSNCKLCDYCLESQNISEEDKKKFLPVSSYSFILETVKKYNEKYGQQLLVCVLLGSGDKRLSEWGFEKYEHFGVLHEYSKDLISAMFEALQQEDFLVKTGGKYPCIGVTDYGKAAIFRNHYITKSISELNASVMQKVKNSKTSSRKSNASKKSVGTGGKGQTYTETLELFNIGKTLEEIAGLRNIGLQTIEDHIIKLYGNGKIPLLKVLNLTDLEHAKKVKTALSSFSDTEDLKLRPIKEALEKGGNTSISYLDIKLALTMIEKGDL